MFYKSKGKFIRGNGELSWIIHQSSIILHSFFYMISLVPPLHHHIFTFPPKPASCEEIPFCEESREMDPSNSLPLFSLLHYKCYPNMIISFHLPSPIIFLPLPFPPFLFSSLPFPCFQILLSKQALRACLDKGFGGKGNREKYYMKVRVN